MKRTLLALCALLLVAGLFGSRGAADAEPIRPYCAVTFVGIVAAKVCPVADVDERRADVYVDGTRDNPDPLNGYVGVNTDEGVVACAHGDYDPNHEDEGHEGNNVVTPIPPDPQSPPSAGSGPCSPTAP